MNHANGERDGYCRECIDEVARGFPICRSAEPADDQPDPPCAWCGHLVTTSAGVGWVPAKPAPAPIFGEVRR